MTARPLVHRVLYEPSEQMRRNSAMQAFIDWLRETRGLGFAGYADLHAWSVGSLDDFWTAVWEYFDVRAHPPYTSVLSGTRMPDVRWFEGALVSYPEHCLCHDPGPSQ